MKAQIDLSNVTINSRTGDFNATSLAHVINTKTVNTLLVQAWLDRAGEPTRILSISHMSLNGSHRMVANRKSTLAFCVNVAHVMDLTNEFRAHGIDARFLHAKTPAFERKALLDSFRAGVYPVLVNCGSYSP